MCTHHKLHIVKMALPLLMVLLIVSHTTISINIPALENVKPTKQKFSLGPLVDALDYKRYLTEVVHTLREDETFNHKLISDYEATRNGKIADHLPSLPRHLRTKLDEAKRLELKRLHDLTKELKRQGMEHHEISNHLKNVGMHIDPKNKKFDVADLRKLVQETTWRIDEIERIRAEGFKQYEMHKRLEFDELLKRLPPGQRATVAQNRYAIRLQHKKIKPVFAPGSKAHLLKVWEEHDRMDQENFNIRTFFKLHDMDDDDQLDEYELKMILTSDINHMFDTSFLDFDAYEREEEMELMMAEMLENIDANKDRSISYEEFLGHTKSIGYEDKHYWQRMNLNNLFTDDEYNKYADENREEVNEMIDKGLISLPPPGIVEHVNPNKNQIFGHSSENSI